MARKTTFLCRYIIIIQKSKKLVPSTSWDCYTTLKLLSFLISAALPNSCVVILGRINTKRNYLEIPRPLFFSSHMFQVSIFMCNLINMTDYLYSRSVSGFLFEFRLSYLHPTISSPCKFRVL
jgi:hypothetical protein